MFLPSDATCSPGVALNTQGQPTTRSPSMLTVSLPRSVTCLLDRFRGCFTAPTFTTFCGLALGFWAQPGLHTVTGMLCGSRLQQAWHHSRAHRFFATARWSADQLGRRPGPQPHPPRRPAHRPVRAGVLQPRHRLVQPARPRPRRRCHALHAGALVPNQGHPVSGRHARQASPGAHRRAIPARSALWRLSHNCGPMERGAGLELWLAGGAPGFGGARSWSGWRRLWGVGGWRPAWFRCAPVQGWSWPGWRCGGCV